VLTVVGNVAICKWEHEIWSQQKIWTQLDVTRSSLCRVMWSVMSSLDSFHNKQYWGPSIQAPTSWCFDRRHINKEGSFLVNERAYSELSATSKLISSRAIENAMKKMKYTSTWCFTSYFRGYLRWSVWLTLGLHSSRLNMLLWFWARHDLCPVQTKFIFWI